VKTPTNKKGSSQPGIANRFAVYLTPAIFQGVLSFLMLPVTTNVLSAEDFGTFALLASLTGFGTPLALMGSSYLLNGRYLSSDEPGRRTLITTILAVGLFISLLFAGVFLTIWPLLVSAFPLLSAVPKGAVGLSLATVILSVPWATASDVITIEGKPTPFAVVLIGQSVVTAAVNVIGLYVARAGVISLFVAAMAGSLVYTIGGFFVLRGHLGRIVSGKWIRELLRIGPVASLGNFAESLQTAVERSLLGGKFGLAQVAIYNHSQQYQQMTFSFVKAVTRSVWPVTLKESQDASSDFAGTESAWTLVHVGLTMIGLFFVFLGADFISFISHGKFSAAAPLVSYWMIFLMIKHMGRAQYGYLLANRHSHFIAMLTLGSIALSVSSMFVLIPAFGSIGALLAFCVQDAAFRVGVFIKGRRLREFGFHDKWALGGILVIVLSLLANWLINPQFVERVVLFTLIEFGLAVLLLRNSSMRSLFNRALRTVDSPHSG